MSLKNKCTWIREEVEKGRKVYVKIEGEIISIVLSKDEGHVRYWGDDLLFMFDDRSVLVSEDNIKNIWSVEGEFDDTLCM